VEALALASALCVLRVRQFDGGTPSTSAASSAAAAASSTAFSSAATEAAAGSAAPRRRPRRRYRRGAAAVPRLRTVVANCRRRLREGPEMGRILVVGTGTGDDQ
jgi:hypothetical protein